MSRTGGDTRTYDRWGGRWRLRRPLPALVWLAFVIFPLVDAVTSPGSAVQRILVIAAAALFVGAYVGLLMVMWKPGRGRSQLVAIAILAAVAVGLTVLSDPGWGFLFTYVAACLAVTLPSRQAFNGVVACSLVAAGCSLAGGGSGGTAVSYGASTIGVGLLMTLLGDLRERNQELCEARAELARVAVVQERERFARDLHDLLGHSLSVIAIKAELAGRLLPDGAEAAAAEVADVEQVARQALGEVRQAVSGYRRPTLDGELEGARVALAAAGIAAEVHRCPVRLDAETEAVLAWAVREGATNVIRHSGARRCELTISADAEGAVVEVLDDGTGGGRANGAGPDGDGGHGIAGLAERAERLRGQIEAGARSDGGGFRLAVSVPAQGSGA